MLRAFGPITHDRYVVQVKSSAGVRDVRHSASAFSSKDFCKVFFVVHTERRIDA
jgi:hypothetical protein